ncbi:hypothetical protein SLS62_006976 [Diatrype stigma]|uniref:Uncharacterized protein n=1 Tax=Diatrype stigma TaxID=117547 RepID=A0AAN9YNQ5_9PEZI
MFILSVLFILQVLLVPYIFILLFSAICSSTIPVSIWLLRGADPSCFQYRFMLTPPPAAYSATRGYLEVFRNLAKKRPSETLLNVIRHAPWYLRSGRPDPFVEYILLKRDAMVQQEHEHFRLPSL